MEQEDPCLPSSQGKKGPFYCVARDQMFHMDVTFNKIT